MPDITSRQRFLSLWQAELSSFQGRCLQAEAAAEEELLALAVDLLATIPDDVVTIQASNPCPATLERLREAGAHLCVALELLPKDAGYMLSRGAGGRSIATVFLQAGPEEVTMEAATPTLALLAACCGALLGACGNHRGATSATVTTAALH